MSFRDLTALTNVTPAVSPISVTLPDGSITISSHTALLDLPMLLMSARLVHVFPGWIGSLLSIGVLCDAGMTAVYTATTVTIYDAHGLSVLSGTRSPISRIWTIDISGPSAVQPTTTTPLTNAPTLVSAAVITEATGTQAQIAAYYHATMGSPAANTSAFPASPWICYAGTHQHLLPQPRAI